MIYSKRKVLGHKANVQQYNFKSCSPVFKIYDSLMTFWPLKGLALFLSSRESEIFNLRYMSLLPSYYYTFRVPYDLHCVSTGVLSSQHFLCTPTIPGYALLLPTPFLHVSQ